MTDWLPFAEYSVGTHSGYVNIGDLPPLPFFVIRGAKDGPRLVVTAGIHASEYTGIESARRLAQTDPKSLGGMLVILPIVNMAGFWARSIYVNPLDGKNINRVFPGRADGSPSERLTHWIVENAMRGATAHIDLHCGDMNETLTPFVLFAKGDAKGEHMARLFGLPYAVASTARGHSYGAAYSIGVPSMLAEMDGNGLWTEPGVKGVLAGVQRIMADLGMIKRRGAKPAAPKILTMRVTTAPKSGFWHPAVKLRQRVKANQVVGTVSGILGEFKENIVAGHDGFIIYYATSLATNAGEALFGVAVK
jgi:hypothetical protein